MSSTQDSFEQQKSIPAGARIFDWQHDDSDLKIRPVTHINPEGHLAHDLGQGIIESGPANPRGTARPVETGEGFAGNVTPIRQLGEAASGKNVKVVHISSAPSLMNQAPMPNIKAAVERRGKTNPAQGFVARRRYEKDVWGKTGSAHQNPLRDR